MDSDHRPETASDEMLVEQYLADTIGANGRAALAALVDRWSGPVFAWARHFLRDRDRALDLSQDCLIRMIESLPRYQARGKFGAWLFTIVHNRCRSVARPRAWNRDPEVDADAIAPEGSGVEEKFEDAESLRRCLAAIDSALEPRERAALWLRAYEELSVDEITRILRVEEPSGARGVLQTARRKLRSELLRRAGKEVGHD